MSEQKQSWDSRVDAIVRRSKRRGWAYFSLGMVVYGGGSALILSALWDKPTIATALVMFLFQLCIMFFGTTVMFPRFDGMFWLGIEANRDSVPAMEKFSETVDTIHKGGDPVARIEKGLENGVARITKALGDESPDYAELSSGRKK